MVAIAQLFGKKEDGKECVGTQTKDITFLDALALILVTLKLCDQIDWSWWLVLMPLYGPILLLLILTGICVFAMAMLSGAEFLYNKLQELRNKNV